MPAVTARCCGPGRPSRSDGLARRVMLDGPRPACFSGRGRRKTLAWPRPNVAARWRSLSWPGPAGIVAAPRRKEAGMYPAGEPLTGFPATRSAASGIRTAPIAAAGRRSGGGTGGRRAAARACSARPWPRRRGGERGGPAAFAAAAEHALAVGKANPAGLCWLPSSRAMLAHRLADRGPGECPAQGPPARAPVGQGIAVRSCLQPTSAASSSNAEIVRAVRAATIRAGIFRDPFQVRRRQRGGRGAGWDRAIWRAAGPDPVSRG